MRKSSTTVILGKIAISVLHEFPEVKRYFTRYRIEETEAVCTAEMSEWDWMTAYKKGVQHCAAAECSILAGPVSDALLPFDRCVIHAAAIRYRDRAWLLAGPSGVGKSTQIKSLQTREPGAFGVICGDRPVLERKEDDSVTVWPSPWNGKENWYGAEAAPLAGIILIQRGEENIMEQLPAREAVIPVYAQLIQTGETTETMELAARFEDRLLRTVPVWRLTAADIPGSGDVLYQMLSTAQS